MISHVRTAIVLKLLSHDNALFKNLTKVMPMMLMSKRVNQAVVLYLVLVFLSACTAGMKSPEDMEPVDVAIWANRIYVLQYDSYLTESTAPGLSDERIEYLRTKREILTELHPLLVSYNTYVDSGTVPEEQLTQLIIRLVYRLTEEL